MFVLHRGARPAPKKLEVPDITDGDAHKEAPVTDTVASWGRAKNAQPERLPTVQPKPNVSKLLSIDIPDDLHVPWDTPWDPKASVDLFPAKSPSTDEDDVTVPAELPESQPGSSPVTSTAAAAVATDGQLPGGTAAVAVSVQPGTSAAVQLNVPAATPDASSATPSTAAVAPSDTPEEATWKRQAPIKLQVRGAVIDAAFPCYPSQDLQSAALVFYFLLPLDVSN